MEASVVLPVYLCLCVVVLMFFNVLTTQWKTQVSINETVRKTALVGGAASDTVPDVLLVRSSVIPIPVGLFGRRGIQISQQAKCRRWVGWDPHEFDKDNDDAIVYVAETGRVYHRSRSCSYLKPSIRAVNIGSVDAARNSGGGRYRRCPLCGRAAGATVYITTYGDAYHSSRSCSGLKRTIYTMKLKEAKQKYPACSKCGH